MHHNTVEVRKATGWKPIDVPECQVSCVFLRLVAFAKAPNASVTVSLATSRFLSKLLHVQQMQDEGNWGGNSYLDSSASLLVRGLRLVMPVALELWE